jgi:hypothetical protein
MKSNVIFVKFHTRLQSTDFVLVVVLVHSPYKILFSSTSTKRIGLNRMHMPPAPFLIFRIFSRGTVPSYRTTTGPNSHFRIQSPLSSDIRLPTSVLRPPPSVFRHPSSVICHLSSVICLPSSVFRHPSSVIRLPTSVLRPPSSVICLPSSVFRLPSSLFHLPSSVLHQLPKGLIPGRL